jgi:hypothetical protein
VKVSSELNFHYTLFSSSRKDLDGNQFVASSLEDIVICDTSCGGAWDHTKSEYIAPSK